MQWRLLAPIACLATFFALDAPAQPLPDAAVVERSYEIYAKYDVHAVRYADGSSYVSIIDDAGKIVFEARRAVSQAHGPYFAWIFSGQPAMSFKRRLEPKHDDKSLESLMRISKDIFRGIMRSQRRAGHFAVTASIAESHGSKSKKFAVAPTDDYGCDYPFELLSCTPDGNCCDTHDDCYAAFNCDALSWLGFEGSFCTACNVALVACIEAGAGNTGQPSYCCYMHNCGVPRNPPSGTGGGGTDTKTWEDLVIGDGGGTGGGGTSYWTPYGSVYYSNGNCTIQLPPPPDGTGGSVTMPCG